MDQENKVRLLVDFRTDKMKRTVDLIVYSFKADSNDPNVRLVIRNKVVKVFYKIDMMDPNAKETNNTEVDSEINAVVENFEKIYDAINTFVDKVQRMVEI